jgi:CDP-diacylglycerol--serine O-phosphatidyltransferase
VSHDAGEGDVPHATRRYRRGIVLLPSIVTVGNLFCGYACIVYSMRGDLATAAPFVGIAIVLDMLDGRLARMTNTTTAFGLEFDSLADVVSFGLAPAVLAFAWGLSDLGRLGWAAGFIFVTAAAIRLARFNIQSTSHPDKRYFIGLPSPAAAGIPAATVFAFPYPAAGPVQTAAAIAVVLVPAVLMVSAVRFRSFKTLNFGHTRSYIPLFVFVGIIALIAAEPRAALLVIAYGYMLSGFVELMLTRLRRREEPPPAASA